MKVVKSLKSAKAVTQIAKSLSEEGVCTLSARQTRVLRPFRNNLKHPKNLWNIVTYNSYL